MTSLVICGIRGRMGQALARLVAESADVTLVGGVHREPSAAGAAPRTGGIPMVRPTDAGALVSQADVVIDFSSPEATRALIEGAGAALDGRALVVGTTGLDDELQQLLDETARRAAVLTAANFSIGVNLLLALVERTAAVLAADAYDVEIVESHHNRKADAPSGTALALGDAVASGRGVSLRDVRRDGRSGRPGPRPRGEIGLHAVRGGGVIGDHAVMFVGERERVELSHHALDRALFAEGALAAARFLAGRGAGRYTMAQVLGLEELHD